MPKTREFVLPFIHGSFLHRYWQEFRERHQVDAFSGIVCDVPVGKDPWAPAVTVQMLNSRKAQRRGIGHIPSIVGCGTCDWEDNGMWQAFRSIGNFSLVDWRDLRGVSGSAEERCSALSTSFIGHIDEREKAGTPVQMAFFYCAGAWIAPAMLEELHRRGIWTVLLGLDDKQQLSNSPHDGLVGGQLRAARAVDLYWTTWRSGADWLLAQGATPWYAPAAADPDLFRPLPLERDIDVLWLGRAYGKRLQLVNYLRSMGFKVQTYGPGWPGGHIPFEETIRLFSRAKVVLGMGGVGHGDQFKHLKGRDLEVPMCGTVYLTSFNPELTDHFEVGKEILCYSSLVECADVLKWILPRPSVAAEIRSAARARCLRDHAWTKRLRDLITLFGMH